MHKSNGKKILQTIGKGSVRAADSILSLVVVFAVLVLFAYGCYGLWDTNQIYKSAGSKKFKIYKPTDKDGLLSFAKLSKMNPDVLGWLTVYGTGIDYPLVQGADNEKYLHTDVEGKYSYSGSLFLDFRNSRDFSNYNTIIYGHHMEKDAMFGDVGKFADKKFFERHRYGNLYYSGKNHGLEFFAFLDANAYDTRVYDPGVKGPEAQEVYRQILYHDSVNTRDVGLNQEDRLVVLSTCTSGTTDGRNLLVARITDEVYKDPFQKKADQVDAQEQRQVPLWIWCAAGILLVLLVLAAIRAFRRRKKGR